jgi:hypothetical protein
MNCTSVLVPFIARNDVSALPRRFCDHDIFREAAWTDLEKFADEVDLSVHRRRVRCIEKFPPKTRSSHLLAHTTERVQLWRIIKGIVVAPAQFRTR